ncbi:RNA polymerase sigma factor [Planctomicrobium sp. SH527]|uniref:RNA polymerase sigma factor n=1 Tax=Planctomicrobium sp. SH527 TaxID=3448123 RepID=UPI003F5BE685
MNSVSDHQIVDQIYRKESRRIFATLVRLLGNFDLAEEAMHEAFVVAAKKWPIDGVPENPRAWLISTGRFKAVDLIRRQHRFVESYGEIAARIDQISAANVAKADSEIEDDRLRMIFTCCHPAIAPEIQVALTLREVCGLTTDEISSAFLMRPPTMAQRIVRGKAKIKEAGIPFEIPAEADLPERLDSVLTVIYLVYNEGYSASSGTMLTRTDLTNEAIRLCRLVHELLLGLQGQSGGKESAEEAGDSHARGRDISSRVSVDRSLSSETIGLLALMLLQESRRQTRTSQQGDIVLLEDQDRSLWDSGMILEGTRLVEESFKSGTIGAYTIQAAIAAVHASATSPSETDWTEIVALYDLLNQCSPSPVIQLNRAVAVAMRDGPSAGLDLIDELLLNNQLAEYHLAYAAKADLCRRLGRRDDALENYGHALGLVKQDPERRFLERRIEQLLQE